jgi:hypothetical protein
VLRGAHHLRRFYKIMREESFHISGAHEVVEVTLDGAPLEVPANRRSINGIRSYMEMLALEKQRILCSFTVNGTTENIAPEGGFCRVQAETIALDEMPLQILKTAFQQVEHAREKVQSVLTLVLINEADVARELWWGLVKELKDPILTLSLLPDNLCGPADGRASLTQLRKWQLEQVASIVRDVDQACGSDDPIVLSNALETRVLPWLQRLAELIGLWHETVLAGTRLGIRQAA